MRIRRMITGRLTALMAVLVLSPGSMLAQDRTMGVMLNDSASFVGYTLFAPMPYRTAYLIDNEGRKVNAWPGDHKPGLSVNFLEDGNLLRTCDMGNTRFAAGGRGGRVELADWEGNVIWRYDYSDELHCQHHDAIRLPNGNVLLLAWEYKSAVEAIAAGRDPSLLAYNSLWPDHLVEVDPDDNSTAWEWHLCDHLIQDYDSSVSNYGVVRDHPEKVDINYVSGLAVADWNHSNGIAYDEGLDQVIISVRQFSEIWVIDHSTTTEEARGSTGGRYRKGGDLLYRWGNPRVYRRGGTQDQTLFGQHDAQWIPAGLPGAGNILLFNNGMGRMPTAFSSVDEIVAPMDSSGFYHLGLGSAFGPVAPVWTYNAPSPAEFYSSTISGCQRLPNGNTLICSGEYGTFFEVTPELEMVWKYINPVTGFGPLVQGQQIMFGTNQVFKVRRYPPDYPGFGGRSLIPGDPVERYPTAAAEPSRLEPSPVALEAGPSPLTEDATVAISLGKAGQVELAVYDDAGRSVSTLARAWLPAGRHEFTWSTNTIPAGALPLRAACRE